MHERSKTIALLALCAIATHASHSHAQSSPAILRQFVEAVNSGDGHRIDTFVEKHFATDLSVADSWPTRCCSRDDVSRTMANIAKRSGGLVVDKAYQQSGSVVAFTHAKATAVKVYVSLATSTGDRERIVNYQVMRMLPTEQYVPTISGTMPLAEKLKLLETAIQKGADQGVFAGTVLVAAGGKVLMSGAYGEADRKRHIPNRIDTKFDIASMGKLFTAIAVAQLVAKGKLDYNAPIIRYLPDYPNRTVASKVTLHQLLTHTSGLADIFGESAPKRTFRRLSDYYPLFVDKPLLFEPGKGQSYSNTGFLVASMLVERASGEEFRAYLKRHIFDPAGMKQTGFGSAPGVAEPYAWNYDDDPLNPTSPLVSARPFYKGLLGGPAAGPGGEYSTAADLSRFADALRSGVLLDPASLDTLIEESYGCFCSARPGHRVYAHTGGGPGIDSFFSFDVDQDLVVILLSNYSPPFAQVLGDAAANGLQQQ